MFDWIGFWLGVVLGGCGGGAVVIVGWREGEEEDRETEKKRGHGFGGSRLKSEKKRENNK